MIILGFWGYHHFRKPPNRDEHFQKCLSCHHPVITCWFLETFMNATKQHWERGKKTTYDVHRFESLILLWFFVLLWGSNLESRKWLLDIQKSKHPAWLKIRFKTNTKLENRPFEDVSPKNQCDFPACHVSELVFSTMILRSDENFHPFVQLPDLHPSEFVHAHQWLFFDLLVTFQFNQQQLFFLGRFTRTCLFGWKNIQTYSYQIADENIFLPNSRKKQTISASRPCFDWGFARFMSGSRIQMDIQNSTRCKKEYAPKVEHGTWKLTIGRAFSFELSDFWCPTVSFFGGPKIFHDFL